MEIKIAVIVGDNGAFSVGPFLGEDTDWAILADMIGKFDDAKNDIVYPSIEKRYIITANVDLPFVFETNAASVEAASERTEA